MNYYAEFHRRLQVLELTLSYYRGRRVVDFKASPFITSCVLKHMDFDVLAVDFDLEEYGEMWRPVESKPLGWISGRTGY